mgnify:CR=1 FL=1
MLLCRYLMPEVIPQEEAYEVAKEAGVPLNELVEWCEAIYGHPWPAINP